jgi:hypothetical protein
MSLPNNAVRKLWRVCTFTTQVAQLPWVTEGMRRAGLVPPAPPPVVHRPLVLPLHFVPTDVIRADIPAMEESISALCIASTSLPSAPGESSAPVGRRSAAKKRPRADADEDV